MVHIKEGKAMARALTILGHAVESSLSREGVASEPLWYTTPEGLEVARILVYARTKISSTWVGLARRFVEQPDVWAEFSAAHRLDADDNTLGEILSQLYHVRSREARRLRDQQRHKRFGRGRR